MPPRALPVPTAAAPGARDVPPLPRADPGWSAESQPKGCRVSGWWKGRRCVRAGWACGMSSPSLARPSLPNVPAHPSVWGTAPLLGCSGSARAGGACGQRQGLRSTWGTEQGSPGWAGCSPSRTSPPAALDAAFVFGEETLPGSAALGAGWKHAAE